MDDCLFCKIAHQAIATDFVYEDEHIVAFNDIDPKAPQHILIIPREHISTLNDTTKIHSPLLGHMLQTASQIEKDKGMAEAGYRTVMNCNHDGGQAVFHIHLHVLGGRQMDWPPG